MSDPVRQACLKLEYANLYPGLQPGVWVGTDTLSRFVARRRGPVVARGRLARHFDFRPVPTPSDPNLLLIDGDELDRILLRAVLMGMDRQFNLIQTGDLETGLRLLAQTSFDLVLLGDTLPQVPSGIAPNLVRQAAPGTPMVCHTAFLSDRQAGALADEVRRALGPRLMQ